jgi:energy-coupling factor transporter ATP-binding protein EcfA2
MPEKNLLEELFEFIEQRNLNTLVEKLKLIEEERMLRKLDKAKDGQGRTLLHAALDTGCNETFRALLDKDLSLYEKNAENKTVLQIAQERGMRELCAILATRQEWQSKIETFRFNRVVDYIQQAFPQIEPGINKDKVLFIGATGSGKSTLLNYLNGTAYMVGNMYGNPTATRAGGAPEVAIRGENIYRSETLYPQVVAKNNLNFVYCDLAGLFDSRGIEQQICAASSANLLAKSQGEIKGLLVLLDELGLNSLRGVAVKKTALALARILKMNPELMDSVQFVITKIPSDVKFTPEQVVKGVIQELIDSLDGGLDQEEMALLFVLREIKRRPRQILLPNIADQGQSRIMIERQLAALTGKEPKLFDFLSHDNGQQCFNEFLRKVAQVFLERKEQIQIVLPAKISDLQAKQQIERDRVTGLQAEVTQINQELNGKFDTSQIQASINNNSAQITTNNAQINTSKQKIKDEQAKISQYACELGGLDTDDMIEVTKQCGDVSGKPTKCTIAYKSPYPLDRIHMHYQGYGDVSSQQIKPAMTDKKMKDRRDNEVVGIYKLDNDAKNGVFEGIFRASKGLIEADVIIYAERRDMHIERIKELKRLSDESEEKIVELNYGIEIILQDNNRLSENIRQDQIRIRAGESRLHVHKENLELRKQGLLRLIDASNEKVCNLQGRIDNLNEAIARNELEIKVNKKLFDTVYEMATILELPDAQFGLFKQQLDEYCQRAQQLFAPGLRQGM